MENLNISDLGPLSSHGRIWQGLGNYGIRELIVKIQEMGKKIYLLFLSGTKVVEGGPVNIVNSQQTLLTKFSNRELYNKRLDLSFWLPSPLVSQGAPLSQRRRSLATS